MKYFYQLSIAVFVLTSILLVSDDATAGNKDRSGQAGAAELLINPWSRTSGMASATTSSVMGLEGLFSNVAGLAFTKKTEIDFSYTMWLKGTDINISNFGLAQRLNESSVMGLSVMSMSFGDIPETTVEQPEGTGATFSPSLLNVNVAFAKAFSNSIYAGMTLKVISHTISDATAVGLALDAGVIYVTGAREQIKFGVALRNFGTKMKYTGDGFSFKSLLAGSEYSLSVYQRSQSFAIPTQLRIGASYDIFIAEETNLNISANFVSNSYTRDQVAVGAEFDLKHYLFLRAGYTYESKGTEDIYGTERTNVYNGPVFGATVQMPFNKEKGTGMAIDYNYQTTAAFKGTHVLGIRLNL